MVVVGRTLGRSLPAKENGELVSDAGIRLDEQRLEGKRATMDVSDGVFPLKQACLPPFQP